MRMVTKSELHAARNCASQYSAEFAEMVHEQGKALQGYYSNKAPSKHHRKSKAKDSNERGSN